MQAMRDERVDEIIVSTFPGEQGARAGCAATSSSGSRKDTKRPVEHVEVEPVAAEPRCRHQPVEAHAADAHAHHGPPTANVSSRIDARVLGMLLFIGSEIMLFGSFFTAYFFVRVVNELPVAARTGDELAGLRRRDQHGILVTSSFTMHWALTSIKRGNRAGLKAGLVLTFFMGLTFLLTQIAEYARIGFAPSDNAFATSSSASPACTGRTCSSA